MKKNEKQQNMEIRKMEIQNDIGVGHDATMSVLNYNNHLQVVDMWLMEFPWGIATKRILCS